MLEDGQLYPYEYNSIRSPPYVSHPSAVPEFQCAISRYIRTNHGMHNHMPVWPMLIHSMESGAKDLSGKRVCFVNAQILIESPEENKLALLAWQPPLITMRAHSRFTSTAEQ